ncbi:hypothetical protein CYLTODRAFT_396884 [Cylindrobasidium torrendii FP15055 ss-10]|uniref:Zn(2)-C6 fungal-type domain-containing protein n=1 Tax=Cylindrobasidium torrendii FP15055 ss-10 TaxID=1314674 RepID=A0A0D7BBJ8_9AGAR|nr:hypothetical protein CYLTODRAFT_396884 [Cylindrobasidium torrendii FP15055 ss-10]
MEGPSSSKARRVQGSCDACRIRKVRCDSATRAGNICTNCTKSRSECTHVAAMSRKNGGLPVNLSSWATDTVSKDLGVHIDSILSENYTPPKDKLVALALLKALARHVRQLEANLKLADSESRLYESQPTTSFDPLYKSSSTPNVENKTTNDDALHLMHEPMSQLQISEPSTRFGSSKDVELIESTLSLKDDVDPAHKFRRPQFWYAPEHPWEYLDPAEPPALKFPSPDLLNDLISLFFRHIRSEFIHGPTFLRQIAEGLHHTSHAFGSVVLAVCALAARYSDDPRVGQEHHKGWAYYRQLRAVHVGQYLKQENLLWDLQLMPLMAIYAYALLLPDHGTMLTAMGIVLSQSRGLHRLKRVEGKPWSVEDEMLKRTFWFIVAFDVYVGSFDGKPRVTDYDRIDADYPLEVDDEYWPGEMLADPHNPWRQPIDVPCKASAFVEHLKLLEIYSFAEGTIYSIRRAPFWDSIGCPEWGRNIVVELDSALNAWLDNLPDHLRWNPQAPTPSALVLYSTYQWVCIQLHRPYMREFTNMAACVTAARSCSHAMAAYNKVWPYIPIPTAFAWMMFSSVILLLNLKNNKMASASDLEDVRKNMEFFARNEDVWQVSGRYHDIIREVYLLVRTPQEVVNERKRKDHSAESMDLAGVEYLSDPYSGDYNPDELWEGIDLESWMGTEMNTYLLDLDSVWREILPGSSHS